MAGVGEITCGQAMILFGLSDPVGFTDRKIKFKIKKVRGEWEHLFSTAKASQVWAVNSTSLSILEEETLRICPKGWLDKSTALTHMGLLSYLRMAAQGTAIGVRR